MNSIELESTHTSGAYGKRNVAIVRGQGSRVWDENGRKYIDCVAGISVANIGHSHPALVQAITAQAQTLITCPEMFYNDQRAQLLARLATITPPGMERFFLCNSGTEAVEGAIKFARLSSGRTEIIATMRGFHGRTLGALSATHKPEYREPFGPLVPGFTHVPFGNWERLATAVTDQTAAIILEPVQGEGGIRPADPEYMQAVRQLCDERGILLILDEIQTGFGRTGRWFAFEHYGIAPDLLCMGKAIAGGVPLGAIGLGERVQGITPGVHGSTFGGNPLACAAALATLDIYEQEGLIARAEEMGAYFRHRLQSIESEQIREVRGLGLMVGVECKTAVMPFVLALMERGVLALNAGKTVIRLLPPLSITREEIDEVVEVMTAVL
jgi:acetylornithine/LysW-gamma-L-lysine aminotransferase